MRDKKAAIIALVCYLLLLAAVCYIANSIENPCDVHHVLDVDTGTCWPVD